MDDDLRSDGGAIADHDPADAAEPDYENADDAAELRQAAQNKLDEQREQQAEAKGLKERLEQKRKEQTVTVELYDESVEFHTLDGDDIEWLEDLTEEFADTGEAEQLDSEQFESYQAARDRIQQLLGEYSVDDELTAEWWGQFAPEIRQQLIMQVREKGAEGVETAAEFR